MKFCCLYSNSLITLIYFIIIQNMSIKTFLKEDIKIKLMALIEKYIIKYK